MITVSLPLFIALLSLNLVWLLVLSFFLRKAITHYNTLGRGVTNQNLSTLLEHILQDADFSKKELVLLRQRCDKIEHEGTFHAQKIGVLRFNPFSDTGGDQSFILAILNERDDGVLLSSLHGRTGTRWYAKTIKAGKGLEYELSSEEKTAIKKAKTIH